MIKDYEMGECRELERNFTVYNPITHSLDILGMYYSVKSSTLYIPRGIDLWYVKRALHLKDHTVEQPDPYEQTGIIRMKYKPRDHEQEEALKFMVGLDQYSDNLYKPQLSVNLNTGKGKTYCSIATISFMRIKSIVITGSHSLLKQWKANILEYTDLVDSDIFFISGSPSMNMILHEKSNIAKNAKIFLCTHATIRSYCDTYGWTNLKEIFNKLGIGMKFIDEAHTNFDNMLMLDFFTNTYKTFYVTATPARSDWSENKIYQLSIKNVPGIDLFDAEKDPHTEYIAIKYNSRPTAYDIHSCKNAYGLNRMKYIRYLIKNPIFWKMMHIVMDMYLKCKGRGLFYIGTNEGIVAVYNWICINYPQMIGLVGIYSSIVSNEQKAIEKNKKLLLSTTKSAGLGEHIEGLKMTVVVAEPFRSEVIARQTLGRTRDPDTFYVELVDMGFKQTRNFYIAKMKCFNKYALSTTDSTIDNYELDKRCEKIIEKQEARKAKSVFIFDDDRFSLEKAKEKDSKDKSKE